MRAFLGIDLPSDLKKSLFSLSKTVPIPEGLRIKWVEEPNFHITLTFYGEITQNLLQRLITTVEKITKEVSNFRVSLDTLGFFPERGKPRVVWIGLDEGKEELYKLFNLLNKGYKKLKLRFEDKFHPHITLFRVKNFDREENLREYLLGLTKEVEKLRGTEFWVDRVKFFESILTSEGPIYKTLREVELKR